MNYESSDKCSTNPTDSVAPTPSNGIDAIIFDCDGVLVDITESYDAAITETVRHVIADIVGVDGAIHVNSDVIEGFKSTGGFNDEVDLAYASILCISVAVMRRADQQDFVRDVIHRADSSGIVSVERYLKSITDEASGIIQLLAYPGETRHTSPVSRVFDELFYGTENYQHLFEVQRSSFGQPCAGLINRDKVLLDGPLADRLRERFGTKMALVTGRGRRSAGYSLKGLLDRFDLDCSAFLEDEPREFAKPNPKRLLDCMDAMDCKLALYVGDSMEDLIMARKATASGRKTIFCAITGSSRDPHGRREMFQKHGADLILDSIKMIPKTLNLEPKI